MSFRAGGFQLSNRVGSRLACGAILIFFSACSASPPKEESDAAPLAEASSESTTDSVPTEEPVAELKPAEDKTATEKIADENTSNNSSSAQSGEEGPATQAETAESKVYVTVKGDTLMKISFKNYGDLFRWKEIYEANRTVIKSPNSIEPGLRLQIAGAKRVKISAKGEKYLIRVGDTLGKISNFVYGSTRKWKKLWNNNKKLIQDPNKIFAGFFLYYLMSEQDRKELAEFRQKAASPARAPASSKPSVPAAGTQGSK